MLFGLVACAAGLVFGQDYPVKPVRLVTSAVGGTTELIARLIAQGLSANLGQQVIVDNRPTGIIPGDLVAKSPADGYTLLFHGSSLWIAPLMQEVPYDPVRDFAPITLASSTPNVIVVHPSLPARSVKDLIALAKSRPAALDYASGATGSSSHLAAELFKAMAGVNIVRIPYKGQGPAILALLGGQVHMSFATTGSVTSHIKSGKLRALAITTARPSTLAPDLPTVAASGLPGYQSASNAGAFAPAGTSASIINRLNQEILRVLNTSNMKERLFNEGSEIIGSTPQEFAADLKGEMTRLGKVIKEAGIRGE
jgi:tripartite-type tricarboxylate transporter receptor subunit TctC